MISGKAKELFLKWFKEEKEKFFKDINAKYKFPEDAYARTREINNIVTRHNKIFLQIY